MPRPTTPRWLPQGHASESEDFYRRFSYASQTPILDFCILLASMALIAGGSLALLLGVGYAVAGDSGAWGFFVVLPILVGVNVALRLARRRAARNRTKRH
jgi:hypothetical protein